MAFPCLAGVLRQGSGRLKFTAAREEEMVCRTRAEQEMDRLADPGLGLLQLSCHTGGGRMRHSGWDWGAGRREPALERVLLPLFPRDGTLPRPSHSSSWTSTHHPRAASCDSVHTFPLCELPLSPGMLRESVLPWLCQEVGGQHREKQRKKSPLSQTPGRHAQVYFRQKKYILKNRVVFLSIEKRRTSFYIDI